VAVSGDDKVAVVDLKTLEVTTTFPAGKNPDGLAWRP
jgi:YVTN family beta-propeller protein